MGLDETVIGWILTAISVSFAALSSAVTTLWAKAEAKASLMEARVRKELEDATTREEKCVEEKISLLVKIAKLEVMLEKINRKDADRV